MPTTSPLTPTYFAALSFGALLTTHDAFAQQQRCLHPPSVSAGVNGGVNAAANAGANAAADANAAANVAATGALDGELNAHVPTQAELDESARLAAQARIQIQAGHLTAALPDLERAFQLSHDVTLLGDLGLCLQAAGRLDEAWLALHRFKLEAQAQFQARAPQIDAALAQLEAHLGGLIVDATAGVPDARLIVRGQVAAHLPMTAPVFLAPGDVSLAVRAAGRVEAHVNAHIAVGAVAHASADLSALVPNVGAGVGLAAGAAAGAGANVAANVPHPPSPSLVIPAVIGTIGSVVGLASIPAFIVYGNVSGSFNGLMCPAMHTATENSMCVDLRGTLGLTNGFRIVLTTVGSVTAVAGLVVGIVIGMTAHASATAAGAVNVDCPTASRGPCPAHPRAVARRAPAVEVHCGPDVLGAGCFGTF